MRQLLFLGTAAGVPVTSSSTSILVEDERTNLLLDVSGGYNILRAFHEADRDPLAMQHIFISHHDADHILGIVPLVRAWRDNPHNQTRTVYCSKDTMAAIDAIFMHTSNRHYTQVREHLKFDIVADRDRRKINDWVVTFFDIGSTKTPQLGCSIAFPDGEHLSFLGDEPLRDSYLDVVLGSSVLLHEAFCTSGEADRFRPHEKFHGTAKEAGLNAVKANAKLLALFHMEDMTLSTRKQAYLSDVRASGYKGRVFVPTDLDVLTF